MLHSKGDLTENKLILMYLLRQADCPLAEDTMNVIVTEPGWMYYFDMCQQLMDLEDAGLVETKMLGGEPFTEITDEGRENLEQFRNLVPYSIREAIDAYVREHERDLRTSSHVHAVVEEDNGHFYAVMSMSEEEQTEIYRLRMEVADRREGALICQNFRRSGPNLYAQALRVLSQNIE